MKRIIDGKTYNTETATRLAEAVMHPQEDALFDDLYLTRHGAFFRHFGDLSLHADHPDFMRLEPLDPADAQKWLERHDFVDVIEKLFGTQPEAGEAESRVTVRMPDSLKSRIEKLAASNNQSLNAWIMRCLETCANTQSQSR
jgi:hypothetical protein